MYLRLVSGTNQIMRNVRELICAIVQGCLFTKGIYFGEIVRCEMVQAEEKLMTHSSFCEMPILNT